jgi:hypothetical protein
MVDDIDRPDVNGVPPRMLAICEQVRQSLDGKVPFLRVTTDDNLCSSVIIRGSFNPQNEWYNGIFYNGLYFTIFINPAKGKRYYEDGEPVTVELSNVSHEIVGKLRKYTGPVDKVIAKIVKWIDLGSRS